MAPDGGVPEIVGATGIGATTILTGLVAFGNVPLAATTLKLKVPAVSGVPLNTPLALLKVMPAGRVPVVDHVIGAVPVAVKPNEYPTPTVALGGVPTIAGATGVTDDVQLNG